jgi:hypothetical protein
MAKLSGPMIDALITAVYLPNDNAFQLTDAVKPSTRKALDARELIAGDLLTLNGVVARLENGGSGYPVALTESVAVTADRSENAPIADWEAELLGINPDRPYVVQQYRNGAWFNVPGMEYHTWGTASVKRNQRHARYVDAVCRVVNVIEDRVCA